MIKTRKDSPLIQMIRVLDDCVLNLRDELGNLNTKIVNIDPLYLGSDLKVHLMIHVAQLRNSVVQAIAEFDKLNGDTQ